MTLRVAVIGAGRMGQGIALALSRSGADVSLLGRSAKAVPAPLAVRVDGRSIAAWTGQPVSRALQSLRNLALAPREASIATAVL